MAPLYFCCIYWFKASHRTRESEEVVNQTPHLKEKSDKSHCVARTSSQDVDTGRSKWWQPFLQSMIIVAWNYLPPFWVCIQLARIYSHVMTHCKGGVGEGKVWVFGRIRWQTGGVNLLFAVPCPCFFLCLDLSFHFYSPDVDECANPRSCPEHSTCHNSLGNYSCVCNSGYISRSGKKSFQGPGEICQGRCSGLLGSQVQSVWKDSSAGGRVRSWGRSQLSSKSCLQNWSQFIPHAFIQQTLLEHLLYAKHYSRDGGYCDNTEKSIYSTGTSYHGENQTTNKIQSCIWAEFAADGLTFFHAVTVVLA